MKKIGPKDLGTINHKIHTSGSPSGTSQTLLPSLPEEIWSKIFSYCDLQTSKLGSQVCQDWQRLFADTARSRIRNSAKKLFESVQDNNSIRERLAAIDIGIEQNIEPQIDEESQFDPSHSKTKQGPSEHDASFSGVSLYIDRVISAMATELMQLETNQITQIPLNGDGLGEAAICLALAKKALIDFGEQRPREWHGTLLKVVKALRKVKQNQESLFALEKTEKYIKKFVDESNGPNISELLPTFFKLANKIGQKQKGLDLFRDVKASVSHFGSADHLAYCLAMIDKALYLHGECEEGLPTFNETKKIIMGMRFQFSYIHQKFCKVLADVGLESEARMAAPLLSNIRTWSDPALIYDEYLSLLRDIKNATFIHNVKKEMKQVVENTRKGEIEKAEASLKKAIQNTFTFDNCYATKMRISKKIIGALVKVGRVEEAEKYKKRWADLSTSLESAQVKIAAGWAKAGQFSRALQAASEITGTLLQASAYIRLYEAIRDFLPRDESLKSSVTFLS